MSILSEGPRLESKTVPIKTMDLTGDPNLLNDLVSYINHCCEVTSVSYRKRTYLNRSSTWYTRKCKGEHYDPDIECTGYDGCEYGVEDCDEIPASARFIVSDPQNIKYNLAWDTTSFEEFAETNEWSEESVSKFIKISEIDPKHVKLNFGRLDLSNSCGFNRDHRGSDHTRIVLDFAETQVLQDGCTLHDYATAFHRLRSHKFDSWYEMFCGAEISKTDAGYAIDLGFGHGS